MYIDGRDSKGRRDPEGMDVRELLIELVEWTRTTSDTVESFTEKMGKNPMLKTMIPGLRG